MLKLGSTSNAHLLIIAVTPAGVVVVQNERLKQLLAELVCAAEILHGNNICAICGWKHDDSFQQLERAGNRIVLHGILSEIVARVHQAHEANLTALTIKDDSLLKICGGYRHPCKVFGDLGKKEDYKKLFDTSRRGFIALRLQPTNRNKSQSIRNDEKNAAA